MSSLCIMKNNDLSIIVWGRRRIDNKVLLERKVVPIFCHAPLTTSSKICTYVSPGHVSFCLLGSGFQCLFVGSQICSVHYY